MSRKTLIVASLVNNSRTSVRPSSVAMSRNTQGTLYSYRLIDNAYELLV